MVVVSAPAEMQRERVLQRPAMTVDKLKSLLAQQLPDAEKRRRADFIVDSGQGIERARKQVNEILHKVAALRAPWQIRWPAALYRHLRCEL